MTVTVGKESEAREYTVHTSWITLSSGFFQKAMSKNWKEAQEKSLTLPEHEPDTFERYLHWVYSKNVVLDKAPCPCSPKCAISFKADYPGCSKRHSLTLAKMYLLGDYLDDRRFCNTVIDLMKHVWDESADFLPSGTTQYIWQTAPSDSPLRHLALEIWKTDLKCLSTGSELEKVPTSFLVELLVSIGNRFAEDFDSDGNEEESLLEQACSFHKHVDDSDACN